MEVKDIFDTGSRVDVILNFRKFMDLEKKTSHFEFPQDFHKGKDLLLGSVHAAGVNRNRLGEVCQYFQDAVPKSKKAQMKLYAYLGMIVCYYILDDLDAINRIVKGKVKDLFAGDRNFFSRVNPTGMGQNILKGLGVAAGGVLSTVPQTRTAGYAMMQWALRMQAEDALRPDYYYSYFYDLKQEVTELEYEKLHRKLEW